MRPASNHMSIHHDGSSCEARIVGEPILYEQSITQEISARLYDLCQDKSIQTLTVNLSAVNYVSTEILAKLLALQKRLQAQHKRLILTGVGPTIADALRLMRILDLFEVVESTPPASSTSPDTPGKPAEEAADSSSEESSRSAPTPTP